MPLSEQLCQREKNSLLFAYADRSYSVSDVLDVIGSIRAKYEHLYGADVVLKVDCIPQLALYLAAFDGYVRSMIILPISLGEEAMNTLIEQSGASEVVEICLENEIEQDSESVLIDAFHDTNWVIPTSGTTDEPKLVSHTLVSLSKAVKLNQEKGGLLRWGLLYDLSRFAGIQVFLQAVLGGSSLVIPQEVATSQASQLFVNYQVNSLSATPSMWRKLIMEGGLDSLGLEYITLGGEIADGLLLKELSARFPASRITHVYASTEAGVGFSVTDGLAGFPIEWLDRELPLGGELQIRNDRLFIRRTVTETKYVGRPEVICDQEGWIDTGDLIEVKGDRCYIVGRENGAINVGGKKVHPSEVEFVLLEHSQVLQARSYGKRNPFMGSVVACDVVVQEEYEGLKSELIDYCKRQLDPFKVPALIKIVEKIELSTVGKLQRK